MSADKIPSSVYIKSNLVEYTNTVYSKELGRNIHPQITHSKVKEAGKDYLKKYVRVKLPKAEERDYHFPPDSNGLERDNRECYIQMPRACCLPICIKLPNNRVDYAKVRRLNPSHPENNPEFTVYFKSNRDPVTGQFDKPEKCKIQFSDFTKVFPQKEVRVILTKFHEKHGIEWKAKTKAMLMAKETDKTKETKPQTRKKSRKEPTR
ncbi:MULTISPECIES: hypothetical protein [Erysipelotrichaceae]|uniref:hypothetical protein n=1 Tax=Ileibacterium valens TaxID=1862668 RepID=UPI00259BEE03|nr:MULTISPECIES: hypothetical protein [Erysipelotrichaceae]